MWWKNTFRRNNRQRSYSQTMLDEAFLRRLERLELNARRSLRGGLSGAHPSIRRLPAPTFSDHRPYSSSDDLRYVDWNAYARQEHLFLKLGETEQDVPVHILLDCSRSMDYGGGDTHKLQYGRMLLAALGYLALAAGDHLTATSFDRTVANSFGPARSKANVVELLRFASAIQPGAVSQLGTAVQQYIRPRTGGMLVLVSDLWAVNDIEHILRQVQPPRWQVLLLHILHRDEIQPPLSGEIELEDSELGETLPLTADANTIERYRQRLEQWCQALETACHRRGASYSRLITDMPLERGVIPFLRERQVLRGGAG